MRATRYCATARVAGVQTPAAAALRVAAELIKRARPDTTIWVSAPTWANHVPLLGNAGLQIREYAYYDKDARGLAADAMLDALAEVPAGDVVLLHGCGHNPSGVDLKPEHWHEVARLANARGFTPFVDLAYQGLGDGLEDDASGVRILADACAELVWRVRTRRISGSTANASARSRSSAPIRSGPASCRASSARWSAASIPCRRARRGHRRDRDERRGPARVLDPGAGRHARASTACAISSRNGSAPPPARISASSANSAGCSPSSASVPRKSSACSCYGIYMVDSSRINVAGINGANLDHFVAAMTVRAAP